MLSDSGTAKNIEGKRENADYQHILLFQQCFQNESKISRLGKS